MSTVGPLSAVIVDLCVTGLIKKVCGLPKKRRQDSRNPPPPRTELITDRMTGGMNSWKEMSVVAKFISSFAKLP